jgi:hypothetical protein
LETSKRCLIAALFIALPLALSGIACKGEHNRVAVQNEEPYTARSLVSTVRMNDPKAGAQLLTGFYAVENNAWRWTARQFSVLLRTPPAAAQRGATVALAFTLPDVAIKKLKNITIAASIDGTPLISTEYTSAGSYVFNADVPASMLPAGSVKVVFTLDKSLPPDGADKRELGIVAGSVSLTSK